MTQQKIDRFLNIPAEMKMLPHWIVWRLEDRGGSKPTKTPYSPRGGYAKTNDPATWATFDAALKAVEGGTYSGIGFVFTGTPFVGFDVDGCIPDPLSSDEPSPEALDALKTLDSYTEYSQSGTGFHVIMRAKLPDGRRRNGDFEMYGEGSPRYFVMTGDVWGEPKPIREDQDAVNAVHAAYIQAGEVQKQTRQSPQLDAVDVVAEEVARQERRVHGILSDVEILQKAPHAGNGSGEKFTRLWSGNIQGYTSQSEADLALMNIFAYWTRNDAAQMDRLFRQSGLMRDKWDRKQSGSTYGAITIQEAIDAPHEVYDPKKFIKDKAARIQTRYGDQVQTMADLRPDTNRRYSWTDIGNGKRCPQLVHRRA